MAENRGRRRRIARERAPWKGRKSQVWFAKLGVRAVHLASSSPGLAGQSQSARSSYVARGRVVLSLSVASSRAAEMIGHAHLERREVASRQPSMASRGTRRQGRLEMNRVGWPLTRAAGRREILALGERRRGTCR